MLRYAQHLCYCLTYMLANFTHAICQSRVSLDEILTVIISFLHIQNGAYVQVNCGLCAG